MSDFIQKLWRDLKGSAQAARASFTFEGNSWGSHGTAALWTGQGPGRPERSTCSGIGATERKGRLQRASAVKWTESGSSMAWTGVGG